MPSHKADTVTLLDEGSFSHAEKSESCVFDGNSVYACCSDHLMSIIVLVKNPLSDIHAL